MILFNDKFPPTLIQAGEGEPRLAAALYTYGRTVNQHHLVLLTFCSMGHSRSYFLILNLYVYYGHVYHCVKLK